MLIQNTISQRLLQMLSLLVFIFIISSMTKL